MVVWLQITGGPHNLFFSFGSKSHETIKEIIQFIYLGQNLFFKFLKYAIVHYYKI